MDGETFGHHRPGLEKMLFEMFKSSDFKLVQVSDLINYYKDIEEVEPVKSTWASSEEDIERDVQFLSWKDPQNEIHAWQWELVNLALKSVYSMDILDSNCSLSIFILAIKQFSPFVFYYNFLLLHQ